MSTDVDELLAALDRTIGDWEARPEAWNPGDPLYRDPRFETYGYQTARPMIQIIEPEASSNCAYQPAARCDDCQVAWSGPEPCWVCGAERAQVALALSDLLRSWFEGTFLDRLFADVAEHRRPPAAPPVEPSLGSRVAEFTEEAMGVDLTDWQRSWLDQVYAAVRPGARRQHDRFTLAQPRRRTPAPGTPIWISFDLTSRSDEDVVGTAIATALEGTDLTSGDEAQRYTLTSWRHDAPRVSVPLPPPGPPPLAIDGAAYAQRRRRRRGAR